MSELTTTRAEAHCNHDAATLSAEAADLCECGSLLLNGVEYLPRGAAEGQATPVIPAVVLGLFQLCKENEESDGGWNGGDVVDLLTDWFVAQGIDVEKGPEVYGGTKIEHDWDDDIEDEDEEAASDETPVNSILDYEERAKVLHEQSRPARAWDFLTPREQAVWLLLAAQTQES